MEFLGKLVNSNAFSAQKRVISKTKQKKVFTEIETDFSAKIGNLNVFSAQKQVISKKKKKKRSPKLRWNFRPKSEIQTLFQAESRHVLHNFGTQFPLGGCFHFFTKNRPRKHLIHAILRTSQANGRARAPPPPPPRPPTGYAIGCGRPFLCRQNANFTSPFSGCFWFIFQVKKGPKLEKMLP